MLLDLIASSSTGQRTLEWIECAALAIEILAVVIIVGANFHAMGHAVIRAAIRLGHEESYKQRKVRLGRALLLGLERLVAADGVRTVALEATLQNVAAPGLGMGLLLWPTSTVEPRPASWRCTGCQVG